MENEPKNNAKLIASAIVIAGILIAGAILLKGSAAPPAQKATGDTPEVAPISRDDMALGDAGARVSVIVYADFQCPFCGAVSGLQKDSEVEAYLKNIDPSWQPYMPVVSEYAAQGKISLAARDFPFLGAESYQAAEAARCAADQGKFWEYHDYLYSHQSGENKGAFSDENLKSFASALGLSRTAFADCLDSNKYGQTVVKEKTEAAAAGVTGTPRAYILKDGKVVDVIDGAEGAGAVREKLEKVI